MLGSIYKNKYYNELYYEFFMSYKVIQVYFYFDETGFELINQNQALIHNEIKEKIRLISLCNKLCFKFIGFMYIFLYIFLAIILFY